MNTLLSKDGAFFLNNHQKVAEILQSGEELRGVIQLAAGFISDFFF